MSVEKIKAKIAKLFALSNSDNEHEAAIALKKANELLVAHNLELSDIHSEDNEIKSNKFGEFKRVPRWKWDLIDSVARCNFCQVLVSRKWDEDSDTVARYFQIIGTDLNVLVVTNTYEYLVKVVDRMVLEFRENYKKVTGKYSQLEINSYKLGLVDRLRVRFYEIKEDRKKAGVKSEGFSGSGIVVSDLYKSYESKIKKYTDGYKITSADKRGDPADIHFYAMGTRDGEDISLNSQVTGTAEDQKQLRGS